MPSYKSNAKSVIGSVVKRLQGLQINVIDKASREIAADLVASNMRRIHNDGQAVDGTDIGDYKEGAYKKKRQEKQKRVDKKNLDFSGKLSKEFSFAAVGRHEIGVGFLTEYGSTLQEAMEEQAGKKIWGVTQEDERVADGIVKRKLNKYLNG